MGHLQTVQPQIRCHNYVLLSAATVLIRDNGAFATLPLRSWRSGQLQAWFKGSPKVGVALLDSRTNSGMSGSNSHVNELEK